MLPLAALAVGCAASVVGDHAGKRAIKTPHLAGKGSSGSGGTLRIVALYDNDNGGVASLFLRGSGLGLSWDKGLRMAEGPDNTFTAELEFSAVDVGTVLEFKTLATDDTVWQQGANSMTAVGAGSATIFPWFEPSGGEYFVAERDVPSKYVIKSNESINTTEETIVRWRECRECCLADCNGALRG